MSHPKYPLTFSPIQYGPIRLKNRIMNLPMMNGLSTPDGKVTPEMVAHMGARAKSGAGLIMIGDSEIEHKYGTSHYTTLDLSDPQIGPGLTALADEVHRFGGKIGIELSHGGVWAHDGLTDSGYRISPSEDKADPMNPRKSRDAIVMDRKMMDEYVDIHVNVAVRLMEAGFDELMIHCGHAWLLYNFLNPRMNHRTDEYGGSLENRMRYPLEVIKAVYEAVGHRMAVDLRVSMGGPLSEFAEQDYEETVAFLRAASPYITGANISIMDASNMATSEYMCQSYYLPHKVNTVWAERIKKENLDVIISNQGSVVTVAEAEEILAADQADVVGMGRAALVDDEHFVKAMQGREDEIRPCMRCAHCTDRLFHFNSIRCSVNPICGREYQYNYGDIPSARKSKRVMIIGGGPAGMQAAQTAVQRGHSVVLYEKKETLGGTLRVASALDDKYDMRRYMNWMIKKTYEICEKVITGTEVTEEIIRQENPDAVLLAIGAGPSVPPIPGINGENVVLAEAVDMKEVEVGDNVVIMGAGYTGCECAIPLAREGKKVTIIDMMPQIKYDMYGMGAQCWMSILRLHKELGINVQCDAKLSSITNESVTYEKNNEKITVPADTVINALGMRVDNEAVEALRYIVPETYTIGDCSGENIMNIDNAVLAGFTTAMRL